MYPIKPNPCRNNRLLESEKFIHFYKPRSNRVKIKADPPATFLNRKKGMPVPFQNGQTDKKEKEALGKIDKRFPHAAGKKGETIHSKL